MGNTLSLAQVSGYLLVIALLLQALVSIRAYRIRIDSEKALLKKRLNHFEQLSLMAIENEKIQQQVGRYHWVGHRKFKVARIEQETSDVRSLYLVAQDGQSIPPFKPGQFLTLTCKTDGQIKSAVRCYSLSSNPNQLEHYRISVKRLNSADDSASDSASDSAGDSADDATGNVENPDDSDKKEADEKKPPGVVSNWIHSRVEVGDTLAFKSPAGKFYYDLIDPMPAVLIAGGIGVTPIAAMFAAIADLPNPPECWLFYGARQRGDLALIDELRGYAGRAEQLRLHIALSGDPELEEVVEFHQGHVSVDLLKRILPANNYSYYLCGPSTMMEQMTSDLLKWGVPSENIHFEAFGPATAKLERQVGVGTLAGNRAGDGGESKESEAFEVNFVRSGKKVTWKDSGCTLLELAEDNGIEIEAGCRAGNCGTCLTEVVEGEVHYAAQPSAEVNKGSCLPCVARPRSSIKVNA